MFDPTATAYALCQRLARNHYENFPVASWLLPRRMRPHVAALYAFARLADDFADEGDRPASERLRLLDDWLARLRRAATNQPSVHAAQGAALDQNEAVFIAVGDTIRRCRLPVTLFEDLLSAFRQDVTTRRYASWEDVLAYCRRSANPVGRLVLRIAGYDAALDASSDALCTALQLTNFWQDLARDWHRGRLYVPQSEIATAGADERDLDEQRMTPGWRRALARAADRTREHFREGRPVCDAVHGRLRFELRLTWLGGERILARLERAEFDVFDARPALGVADVPPLLWRASTWT